MNIDIYIYITIVCSKCGYQFSENIIQNQDNIIDNASIMVLVHSYDPFNTITRVVKKELHCNNIKIIYDSYNNLLHDNINKNLFLLDILNSSENRVVVSVFKNGIESEYEIILKVQAQCCLINKKHCYPINIHVRRTLLNDPNAGLSNLTQENEILDVMRVDAAQQLVQKFLIQLKNVRIDFINNKN